MAVIIESSYGKTIGLPGYSSHKFCLSVKTEVADLSQVGAEAERVYQIMQTAVDAQMAQPGWVPNGRNGNGNGGHAATPGQTGAASNGGAANGGASAASRSSTSTASTGNAANGGGANSHSTNDGNRASGGSANANGAPAASSDPQPWNCSSKQRALIEDIAQRNKVEIGVFGDLSRKRFGKELGQLNRLEASGLIAEIIEVYGDERPQGSGRRQYQSRQPAANARRGT